MRVVLVVLFFMASSGIIFAGYNAETSLPGLASNLQTTVQQTCGEQATQGDRLLNYLSSSDSESGGVAHDPNKSTVSLLRYLTCGFVD